MLDPTSQVTVGGSLLAVIWMLLKFKPWKNGGKSSGSGEQSVDFWKSTIREVVKGVIEDEFRTRNEEIRRIVREEVDRSKGRR